MHLGESVAVFPKWLNVTHMIHLHENWNLYYKIFLITPGCTVLLTWDQDEH